MPAVYICDDDSTCLRETERAVRAWAQERGQDIGIRTIEGPARLRGATFAQDDILLLDILMPETSGMDLARELRARGEDVRIVFLTSSTDFAIESYEVKADNYLLKPVEPAKLARVLDEWRARKAPEPTITVKTSEGFLNVAPSEIYYIEARSKKVFLYLTGGRCIQNTSPLYAFEDALAGRREFFKCHRSYLVNLLRVKRFTSTEVIMRNGSIIPIARGGNASFRDAYFSVTFGEVM